MIIKVKDWVFNLRKEGLLCDEYTEKFDLALNRAQIADLAFDANGMSYLPEMLSKGHGLPYSVIEEEFGSFINGRYKRDKDGYTSSLYCEYEDEIELDTTCTCLLGCECSVTVPSGSVRKIYADSNCRLTLKVPANAKLYVHYWEGAAVDMSLCEGQVKLTKKG